MTMKRTKLIAALLGLCVVAVVSIGVTLAYLRDSAKVVNTFTVGELSITLEEPSYQADDGETVLVSGMGPIPKDPTVTLSGEDAYVFMQLTIPEVFEHMIDPPVIESDWELVAGTSDIYVYKGENNDYRVRAGELQPLFRELRVKDFGDSEAQAFKEAADKTIVVKAAAIQYTSYTMADALDLVDWSSI